MREPPRLPSSGAAKSAVGGTVVVGLRPCYCRLPGPEEGQISGHPGQPRITRPLCRIRRKTSKGPDGRPSRILQHPDFGFPGLPKQIVMVCGQGRQFPSPTPLLRPGMVIRFAQWQTRESRGVAEGSRSTSQRHVHRTAADPVRLSAGERRGIVASPQGSTLKRDEERP